MAKKKSGSFIGGWTFLIGVLLAIIIPLFGTLSPGMIWFLVLVGVIVGLLNVSGEEAHAFMMSGIVLIIASSFGAGVTSVITVLSDILNALLLIFVPATIVVAIKNVFSLAHR
ncbi:MAG: hypothetical protein ABIF88_01110 [archaeon]